MFTSFIISNKNQLVGVNYVNDKFKSNIIEFKTNNPSLVYYKSAGAILTTQKTILFLLLTEKTNKPNFFMENENLYSTDDQYETIPLKHRAGKMWASITFDSLQYILIAGGEESSHES